MIMAAIFSLLIGDSCKYYDPYISRNNYWMSWFHNASYHSTLGIIGSNEEITDDFIELRFVSIASFQFTNGVIMKRVNNKWSAYIFNIEKKLNRPDRKILKEYVDNYKIMEMYNDSSEWTEFLELNDSLVNDFEIDTMIIKNRPPINIETIWDQLLSNEMQKLPDHLHETFIQERDGTTYLIEFIYQNGYRFIKLKDNSRDPNLFEIKIREIAKLLEVKFEIKLLPSR